jgi:1,2-dihydroxy-3-keto-5-methylthiopentene dioxygenase
MATLRIPEENIRLEEDGPVAARLSAEGIVFERWAASKPLADDATTEAVLDAYAPEIERLKREGGYVTADVIDVTAATPGIDAMLARFNREHWHDEDEVRFIVAGRGLFHIHSRQGAVLAIEVGPGDLLRVPRGTWHWFDLCADKRIRAIRLFQDPTGWTPHYTDSGAEQGREPVCLGPAYLHATAGPSL